MDLFGRRRCKVEHVVLGLAEWLSLKEASLAEDGGEVDVDELDMDTFNKVLAWATAKLKASKAEPS